MIPIRKLPDSGPSTPRCNWDISSTSCSTRRTRTKNSAPNVVRCTCRAVRSTKGAPSSASSSLICTERAGCDTLHASAARPKCRSRANASKYRKCFIVKFIIRKNYHALNILQLVIIKTPRYASPKPYSGKGFQNGWKQKFRWRLSSQSWRQHIHEPVGDQVVANLAQSRHFAPKRCAHEPDGSRL